MRKIKKNVLSIIVLTLFLIATACSKKEIVVENNSGIEDVSNEIIIEANNTDEVFVNTKYGDIKYPYAFSDVIKVQEMDDGNSYLLVAETEEFSAEIYSVCFAAKDGVYVGKTSSNVTVSLEVYDTPEEIDENLMNTFYAAQETLNDVIISIYEWDGFEAAE